MSSRLREIRKRRYSVSDSTPSKRLKRNKSTGIFMSHNDIEFENDMSEIHRRYTEQCSIKKEELNCASSVITELFTSASSTMINFNETLQSAPANHKVIISRGGFLKKFVGNVIKNLVILNNKVHKLNEFNYELNVTEDIAVTNSEIVIESEAAATETDIIREELINSSTIVEEIEECDTASVHSNSSVKTVLNVPTNVTSTNHSEALHNIENSNDITIENEPLSREQNESSSNQIDENCEPLSTPHIKEDISNSIQEDDIITGDSNGLEVEKHLENPEDILANIKDHDDTFCEDEMANPIATVEKLEEIKADRDVVQQLHTEVPDIDCKDMVTLEPVNRDPIVQLVEVTNEQHPESQIEFLKYFGLKYNYLKHNSYTGLDEDAETKNIDAFNFLIACPDEPRSSSVSSLSNDGFITEEEDNEDVHSIGRIVNRLPSLPYSTDTETDTTANKRIANKNNSISEKTDKEANEINRLTNLRRLNTIKNSNNNGKKTRYGRLSTKSKASVSDEDDYISDSVEIDNSISAVPNINNPMDSQIDLDIHRLNSLLEDTEDADIEEDLEETTANKTKKRHKKSKINDSDKENSGSRPQEVAPEEALKRKWAKDKLLTEKLTDSDSDSNNENKLRKKRKLNNISTNEDKEKNAQILIESDTYDSDIEFISEIKHKQTNILKNLKNDISVETCSESDSSNDSDEDTNVEKTGRKNIRAILSDETLEEATKKATLAESKRQERLTQQQKSLDMFLSQTSVDDQPTFILDFEENTKQPLVAVHPKLTERLKPHQEQGVRFMWDSCYESVKQLQEDEGTGCILAHCMGLGKTFQVVTLIHTLFSNKITNTKHVLVVCPLSVALNWKNEFTTGLKHVPYNQELEIYYLSESLRTLQHKMDCVFKWKQNGGVLVLGYEAFQRLSRFKDEEKLTHQQLKIKQALVDPGPDLVVLDEGHLLKNGQINRTRSLMKIKTKRRIVLTGTPLQNNLKEYYHMVQFVKPNLLGSYAEYLNRFVNPITNGQFGDSTDADIKQMKMRSHVLHKMLKGTIQRFELSELCNYLPPRCDYALFIKLNPLQMQLYRKYKDIHEANVFAYNKMTLFHNYHVFQCISSHPYVLLLKEEQRKSEVKKKNKEVDVITLEEDPDALQTKVDDLSPDWWKGICPQDVADLIEHGSKFNIMLRIIHESEKIGDKVLIFASSLIEMNAIEHFLKKNETETSKWRINRDYFRMDGSVSPETRLQQCDSFNNKKNKQARVFLLSYKVGGLGLNLIAANRVILMDVSWNPAIDNQSVFRSYRFGQTKPCYVYRLVAMGTMEQVVYDRQVTKSAIATRVVDAKQTIRCYKREDIEELYRVNFHLYDKEREPHILPEDPILKIILSQHQEVYKYHEHNALLENRPDEQLNDDQRRIAWEEYNREQQLAKIDQKKRPGNAMNSAATASGAEAASSLVATSSVPTTNSTVAPTSSKNTSNLVNVAASSAKSLTTGTFSNSTLAPRIAVTTNSIVATNSVITTSKVAGTTSANTSGSTPNIPYAAQVPLQSFSLYTQAKATPKGTKQNPNTLVSNSAVRKTGTPKSGVSLPQSKSLAIGLSNSPIHKPSVNLPQSKSLAGGLSNSAMHKPSVNLPQSKSLADRLSNGRSSAMESFLKEIIANSNKQQQKYGPTRVIPKITSVTGAPPKPIAQILNNIPAASSTNNIPSRLANKGVPPNMVNKPKPSTDVRNFLNSTSRLMDKKLLTPTSNSATHLPAKNMTITKNLGYTILPDQLPPPKTKMPPSKVSNRQPVKRANSVGKSINLNKNIFETRNLSKEVNIGATKRNPTPFPSHLNREIIEIVDGDTQVRKIVSQKQDALITALQSQFDITVQPAANTSNIVTHTRSRNSESATFSSGTTQQTVNTANINNGGIIEID